MAKRFPEHHLRVVGGFYFLRFLCPALVCPEGMINVKQFFLFLVY